MLEEDGKYYVAMRAVPCPDLEEWSEADYAYGKWLLRERPPVLTAFLEKKLGACRAILCQLDQADPRKAAKRRREVEEKIKEIRGILEPDAGHPQAFDTGTKAGDVRPEGKD